jgi:hypothetical protein
MMVRYEYCVERKIFLCQVTLYQGSVTWVDNHGPAGFGIFD